MNDNHTQDMQNMPEDMEAVVSAPEEKEAAPNAQQPPQAGKKKYKAKKHQRKGCATALIWVLCIVAVSVGLAVGALVLIADFLGVGKSGTAQVEIKQGTSSAAIARQLDEAGVIRFSTLFRLYTKLMGFDGTFKYGVYTIDKESGYESIAQTLQEEGAKAETVKVTIPEFAGMDEIRKRFVAAGICDEDQFREAASDLSYYSEIDFVQEIPVEQVYYKLEGYLFPDTYEFYKYGSTDCARQAIKKCLILMEEKLKPYRKEIEKSDFTVHEILTLASIIESESGNAGDEDRAKVSAVFYNRLNGVNWEGPKKLQSDPSTKYPYGNGRYDTYEIEGLPPGPIGSPSVRSIYAAIHPEKNFKYTYFVTDKNGKFYFNDTLSAHNKTINKLKSQGLWMETTLG